MIARPGTEAAGPRSRAPLGHRRLSRRPVEREHAPTHQFVAGLGEFRAGGARDADRLEQGDAVLDRGGQRLLEVVLAGAGRLPDLGEVVPHVVGVEQPQHVARPAAEQLGPHRHGAHADAATPVVADEVDRSVVGDDAGSTTSMNQSDVLLAVAPKPSGIGHPNPGRCGVTTSVRVSSATKRLPDDRGLGVAMEQDSGHGQILPDRARRVGPAVCPIVSRPSSGEGQRAAAFLSNVPAKAPVCSPWSMNT